MDAPAKASPPPPSPPPPPPPGPPRPPFARRHSTVLKLIGVGGLILVMLIPLLMIEGVLSDRLQRRNEAVDDITSAWGKDQQILGPILGVPYQYRAKAIKEIAG